MGINEMLSKNSPINKRYDRENKSDFMKLVDRNTELVDELKYTKEKLNIITEYVEKNNKLNRKILLGILKGEYYE